tara:strand:+ start:406 stop:1062 length:657 start_codon:yes stop_codon:yes gene_type:complete
MTTQIATDTELSAVNSILGSIGQSPVTTLGTVTTDTTNTGQEVANTFANPQIAMIHGLLMEATKDIQNEGWHFNKEDNVKISPDENGHFLIPTNYLRYDVHGGLYDRNRDVVRKNGKLYDNVTHTDVFTEDMYVDITYLLAFNDVPPAIQRYIIARASVRAATQLVSNPDLVKLLQLQEAQTKATALEYDCEQGDHTFFGFPSESNYRSYQPYKALIR